MCTLSLFSLVCSATCDMTLSCNPCWPYCYVHLSSITITWQLHGAPNRVTAYVSTTAMTYGQELGVDKSTHNDLVITNQQYKRSCSARQTCTCVHMILVQESCLLGGEGHCYSIHAISFASGCWAIIKHMTQMSFALVASDLQQRQTSSLHAFSASTHIHCNSFEAWHWLRPITVKMPCHAMLMRSTLCLNKPS